MLSDKFNQNTSGCSYAEAHTRAAPRSAGCIYYGSALPILSTPVQPPSNSHRPICDESRGSMQNKQFILEPCARRHPNHFSVQLLNDQNNWSGQGRLRFKLFSSVCPRFLLVERKQNAVSTCTKRWSNLLYRLYCCCVMISIKIQINKTCLSKPYSFRQKTARTQQTGGSNCVPRDLSFSKGLKCLFKVLWIQNKRSCLCYRNKPILYNIDSNGWNYGTEPTLAWRLGENYRPALPISWGKKAGGTKGRWSLRFD